MSRVTSARGVRLNGMTEVPESMFSDDSEQQDAAASETRAQPLASGQADEEAHREITRPAASTATSKWLRAASRSFRFSQRIKVSAS